MRKLLPLLALAAIAAPLAAQNADPMPASYRQVQLAALKEQRRLLLSFADSMPERLYRSKATPIQRSFAEQVQHAAGSAAFIAGSYTRNSVIPVINNRDAGRCDIQLQKSIITVP